MIPDGLDLSSVQIHNSPDIRGWAATSTITRMEFRASGVHVQHSKNRGAADGSDGSWPNFHVPGWDEGGEGLQYTLWLVEQIGGQWHSAGGIQFWRSCDENGGPPENFSANWFYDSGRWGPMTGYQPRPGEQVGFLVTAGDARGHGVETVHERSQVVVIPFPRSGDVWILPAHAEPQPPETPQPEPTDPPTVPPSLTPVLIAATQVDAFMARFDAIDHALAQGRTDLKTLGTDLVKQLPAILKKALTGR